jgi:hypothetical protein
VAIRRMGVGREDADGCWVSVQSTVIIETCLSGTSIYLRPKRGVTEWFGKHDTFLLLIQIYL